MKPIKTFLLNGLILTITALLLRCIGMFFNSYVSQKIGTEAIGLYGLLMSIYGFAVTLALSGINIATTKIISEEIATGNTQNINIAMKKCLIFSILFSCISSILLITFAPLICTKILNNKITCVPFYIISISLPFIAMSSCLSGYFSAIRDSIKPSSEQILEQTLKVILISLFLNHFMPCGLEYICISLILGNIISEIFSFFYIYLLYRIDKRKYLYNKPTNSFFEKRILEVTIPVGLTSLIRSGLSTIKQILIPLSFQKSGITYKQALSNYGLISGMTMPLILFPNIIIISFSNLLLPEFTEFNTCKNYNKIKKISNFVLKYTTIFSVLIAVLLFIFSDKLGYLIYKSSNVAFYIRILAPIIPFIYVDTVIDTILKSLDKHINVLLINILDLILSILFIFIIIPKFGIPGYIFVIYFSELLNFSISFYTLKKNITGAFL